MSVRIRGIYATALTAMLAGDLGVVQASPAIDERFPERSLPTTHAAVFVETSQDRQGVSITGDGEAVEAAVGKLRTLGRDALAWADPLPHGGIFVGDVTETSGRGAVVNLGEGADSTPDAGLSTAGRSLEGFLPFEATGDRIEPGDRRLVQVREPRAPWSDSRPVLDTALRVEGELVSLRHQGEGSARSSERTVGGPSLVDVLPEESLDGWVARWGDDHEDADLDALGDALAAANERAGAIDEALATVEEPRDASPGAVHADEATAWVWFGRESRFGLDDRRREVTATMPGHHRIKAGARAASTAVDFVEAVCPAAGAGDDEEGEGFPFGVVTDQFGPREGDRVGIGHGKPDGSLYDLGPATVAAVEGEGTVTLEREMTPGGTYDGLSVDRHAGDLATTTITEGRWWYPTIYRSDEGERRGTYVNVCTPVEVFPEAVRYVDLHVDVVKHADGTVERLDDDELEESVDAGDVPHALAEKARDVASAVERALSDD
jgi:protein associated with RNAse G/E